ncbi:MAG: hypothetical protein GEU99_14520 [Luteitalea sp.]|nr:hypothetical protein [Luteitalea sp.]
MRIIPCWVLIVHVAAGIAHSQTFNELQVQLGAYTLSDNGGERPLGVWRSTGPLVIGKPTSSTFSVGDTCDAFTVSSGGSLREDATTAWRIELTPIRVVRDAVTFRLRWIRLAALRQQIDQVSFDSSKASRSPKEDIELTLRPGESWPVDSVPVSSGAKTVDGQPCRGRAASIRVSVDSYPSEEVDRRLVVADLWLVERLSNGTEVQRSHALSVRGLPNRPFRFYFDSIVDANVSLDIYGMLIARLESGAMAISVETRSRWGHSSDSRSGGPQRSVESVIQVKPAEIVEIRLPRLGDGAGTFARREFSIRIQARQLR